MKREYGLKHVVRDGSSYITVGTFDGIHVGHQAIVRYLVQRSRQLGGQSTVLSFDPHPREVIQGEIVPLLTTIEERASALEKLGLDRFVVAPFTEKFSDLSAEDFVSKVLVEKLGVQEVVIGYDHAFGKDRGGNRQLLEQMGARLGFTVDVIPPEIIGSHPVSSSTIRRLLLEEGDVQMAAQMLGRFYSVAGKVIRGDGRGKQIGYPTANIRIEHPRKVTPKEGVYAVLVSTEASGHDFGGMMNIGRRPTFDGMAVQLEVHLFDYDGDLYEQKLRVSFAERLRDERRFASVSALQEQLVKDQEICKKVLESL